MKAPSQSRIRVVAGLERCRLLPIHAITPSLMPISCPTMESVALIYIEIKENSSVTGIIEGTERGGYSISMMSWTHDYAVANNQVEIHLVAVCLTETTFSLMTQNNL
jgi:hypothetical protein